MQLSDSIARAAAIAPESRTGTLQDVEHIVVLMQENRSFDQYFGVLRGVRGFGDPRPVVLPSGKPVWYQSDGTRDVLPFRPEGRPLGGKFLEDLDHEWNSGHEAFNQGKYDHCDETLELTLTNGDTPCALTITDTYGVATPATYPLKPGASITHTTLLATTHGWYELTVTSDTDPTFVRRVAGHVENGRPSMSDPGIITE